VSNPALVIVNSFISLNELLLICCVKYDILDLPILKRSIMFKRSIEINLFEKLKPNKAVLIFGARRIWNYPNKPDGKLSYKM
jgi:hypothetical protein